jgi:hypothetical protein
MSFFAFDRCSVELIFLIFEYLSGDDILFSFFHTVSYMDSVLEYYNNYSFNLMSITRKKFDFIFSNIELNQIISMILSDGRFTAGQIGLFLSRYSTLFHLFSGLRSLTLHCAVINEDKYKLLIEAFKEFKNLRLLRDRPWLHQTYSYSRKILPQYFFISNERASLKTYKSKFLAHSIVPFKSYKANTE